MRQTLLPITFRIPISLVRRRLHGPYQPLHSPMHRCGTGAARGCPYAILRFFPHMYWVILSEMRVSNYWKKPYFSRGHCSAYEFPHIVEGSPERMLIFSTPPAMP